MINLKYAGHDLRVSETEIAPGVVGTYNTSEAENWQFFLQDGVYYVRNYHWGSGMQFGLTPSNKTKPQMYARNADPGQQWVIRQEGRNFVMTNQLAGPSVSFALPNNNPEPGMYSGIGGEQWNVTINESAANGRPINAGSEWLTLVTSTSAIWTSISSQSVPTASPSSTPTSLAPSSNLQSPTPPSTSTSSSLPGGAIAGIVVGAIAVIGALVALLYFCLARRRKTHAAPAYDPHAHYVEAPPVAEKYAHRTELSAPTAELPTSEHHAVELESGRAYAGHK